jgi:hypothetical protein
VISSATPLTKDVQLLPIVYGSFKGAIKDSSKTDVMISNAIVTVMQFSGMTFFSRSDTTGSDGIYGFDSLAVGKYSINVTAAGFTAKTDSIVLTDTIPMTKNMELQPIVYGSVSGIIRDTSADSTPIPSAIVTLMRYSGMTVISKTDTTDADGKYGFDSLPTGNYTMTVTAAGFVTKTDSANVADATPLSKNVVLTEAVIAVNSSRQSRSIIVPTVGITSAKTLRLTNFTDAGNVRLYDMKGRLAYSRAFNASNSQVEIPLRNSIASGTYAVTVVQKKAVSRCTIIIP